MVVGESGEEDDRHDRDDAAANGALHSSQDVDADADADAIVKDGPLSGRLAGEPDKTLQDARFVIGDYVSCAIFAPGTGAAEAGAGTAGVVGRNAGPMGRGGRENGFGGGFRGRGGGYRGQPSTFGRLADQDLLRSEWRRGERIPDGPAGRSYGRGRTRGW